MATYRRAAQARRLLESLSGQDLGCDRFEVIVVDDASDDATPEVLGEWGGRSPYGFLTIRTAQNDGPAAARNAGWRAASAPIVAFTDDDCSPEPHWLSAGVEEMSRDIHLGVVQGRTVAPEPLDGRLGMDHYVWRVIEGPTPHFEACNIFYRREALAGSGGFDEDIAWWGEDTAAGWRVLEAGWGRGFCRDAVVVHPVERRGWWWNVRAGWYDSHVVRLAAEHPGFRAEAFWRPWAYRRDDAAFASALVGLALAVRYRPAALAALPYVWWRRPSIRHRSFPRLCAQLPVVDAARLAGALRGSATSRVLVL